MQGDFKYVFVTKQKHTLQNVGKYSFENKCCKAVFKESIFNKFKYI